MPDKVYYANAVYDQKEIKAVNKVSEALGLGTIPVIKEFKKETYKFNFDGWSFS